MEKVRNYDLIEESTVTTGTGDITLGGALPGRRAFWSVITAADKYFVYRVRAGDESYWEIGLGRRKSDGTLARVEVYETLAAGVYGTGAALDLPVGEKYVMLVQSARNAPAAGHFATRPEAYYEAGLAWGDGAKASGPGSVAFGRNARAAQNSIAFGDNADAQAGQASVAFQEAKLVDGANGSIAGPNSHIRDNPHAFMLGAKDPTTGVVVGQGGLIVRSMQAYDTAGADMSIVVPYANKLVAFDALLVGELHIAAPDVGYVTPERYCARVAGVVLGGPSTSLLHSSTTEIWQSGGLTFVPAWTASSGAAHLHCPATAGKVWWWTAQIRAALQGPFA